MVRRSLYFWNGKKHGLFSYCIMPNHVHVLIQPLEIAPPTAVEREAQEPGECIDLHSPLASIMHSIKSYTAHEANKMLRRTGAFWRMSRMTIGFAIKKNWNELSLTSTQTLCRPV